MNDATARDRLAGELLSVLVDSSNFPERARARLLGQDMRPLAEKCATAIIASDWLAEHDRKVAARAYNEGADDFYL